MKYLILALALLAAGCEKRSQQEYSTKLANEVSYSKDARTGLCYAYTWLGGASGGPAFSHVPCNPEVEVLVITDKSEAEKQ